jgi:WXG100 family type VII secretion target
MESRLGEPLSVVASAHWLRLLKEASVTIPGPVGGGGQLGYDPAAMRTGLTAMDTATTEVCTVLNSIQAEVDGLAATRRAQSNLAFTDVHLRWATRAADINAALQALRDSLAAADVRYTGTEQAQVDRYAVLAHSI